MPMIKKIMNIFFILLHFDLLVCLIVLKSSAYETI
jgi:hypothetical protein